MPALDPETLVAERASLRELLVAEGMAPAGITTALLDAMLVEEHGAAPLVRAPPPEEEAGSPKLDEPDVSEGTPTTNQVDLDAERRARRRARREKRTEKKKSNNSKAPDSPAAARPVVDGEWRCVVCNEVFESRNKMFQHIKRTGHAVPRGAAPVAADSASRRRRRR